MRFQPVSYWLRYLKHLNLMRRVGFPEPGKTVVYDASAEIDLDTIPLNGGFLVKVLVLSIDPYMRGRMRDASIKSYAVSFSITVQPSRVLSPWQPAFKLGRP